MSEPFTYPRPAKPPIVREIEAIRRVFNAGLLDPDVVSGLRLATRALLDEMELARDLTAEEKAQIRAYNRAVDAYNEQVKRHNARLRAARERAEAEREQAAVKKARCDKCFLLHGPGQEECW